MAGDAPALQLNSVWNQICAIPSSAVKLENAAIKNKRWSFNVPKTDDTLEVLLAHPGGPFFRKKDMAFGRYPKAKLNRAKIYSAGPERSFEEEVGIPANGDWIDLGWVKQKGGKTVYAWAFEGKFAG